MNDDIVLNSPLIKFCDTKQRINQKTTINTNEWKEWKIRELCCFPVYSRVEQYTKQKVKLIAIQSIQVKERVESQKRNEIGEDWCV